MRRRGLTIVTAMTLALSAPTGNASLEADCYVAGGYFDATYMAANYLDEACVPPDPPSPVSSSSPFKNLFRFNTAGGS